MRFVRAARLVLTREQRDFLRTQIDVRVRERLSERSQRGARPGGYASSQGRRAFFSSASDARSERVSKRSEG
jgi:hypothetical protein